MPDGGFLGEIDLARNIQKKEELASGWIFNQTGHRYFKRDLKATDEMNNSNMVAGLEGAELTFAVRALQDMGYSCKSINSTHRVYKNPRFGTIIMEALAKVRSVEFIRA